MQIGASDFQGTMPVTIMRRISKRDVKAHASPRLFRRMPEQRPHIGERFQIHDGWDCQRPGRGRD
jgi:hypothetical protein